MTNVRTTRSEIAWSGNSHLCSFCRPELACAAMSAFRRLIHKIGTFSSLKSMHFSEKSPRLLTFSSIGVYCPNYGTRYESHRPFILPRPASADCLGRPQMRHDLARVLGALQIGFRLSRERRIRYSRTSNQRLAGVDTDRNLSQGSEATTRVARSTGFAQSN